MASHDELHEFVREGLARGASRRDLETVLAQAGWNPVQSRAALAGFSEVAFPVPVPRPRPVLDARDAFLYLVLFSTLYVCAFHFGSLIFEFINRWFPDPAFANQERRAWAATAIRWSMASLIVAGPVFLFVTSRVQRALRDDPAKRGSKVRRWLTYLTLTIASGVLIGDFITLVFNVLSGELSVRFMLKVATVAGIAGATFLYYLLDLQADEREVRS